ncbi:NgrE [Xenorhabdus miraniensis]|uniref:NgrE n=2 Tax=Xenorhabdus miraniensis TaxID=351674 RepID=A0A2D0JTZ2_9GAMM|nr:NgrE [Xenorhabdus miraniensis]
MIQAVNSDTELVLADAAKTTLNNVKYQIQITVPDSVSDGVRHIVANTSYLIGFLQNMDKWMSQNGTVEVTLPNGQTVSLQSIRALQAAMEGKLDKGQNGADIPNKTEFVRNIGLGNALKVGDYGMGGLGLSVNWSDDESFFDFVIRSPSQFFRNNGASYATHRWASGILCKAGNTFSGFTAHHTGGGVKFFAGYTAESSGHVAGTAIYNVWTDRNAVRDNSGYLRPSSPIIQIHPDGTFTTNDESEGATVTKLGLGHYQITGVLGYNADGAWGVHGGISVPRDVNGNELVYVEDKVLPDGAIDIKVTHRQNTHMPARLQNRRMRCTEAQTYYTDDEPCDLPAGTRLDVRVQMPEDSVWNVRQGMVGL